MANVNSQWSIAIYGGASPLALSPHPRAVNPVLTGRDVIDADASFVADPFMIFDAASLRWSMYFEVMDRAARRGRIGMAISEDGLAWRYQGIVLAEPFHLSYPFVFEHEGERYMIPESCAADQIRLYRAAQFPDVWTLDAVLLEGLAAADTSLLRHDGRWWMFSCTRPDQQDVLRLWSSESLHGPWREHPRSPLVDGDRTRARPAGRPLCADARLYRFAQDCGADYGTSVRAVEITLLTADDYAERDALPEPLFGPGPEEWNARRMHHVDAHRIGDGRWIACVDGDRPRRPRH